jgi:hypothetical protein
LKKNGRQKKTIKWMISANPQGKLDGGDRGFQKEVTIELFHADRINAKNRRIRRAFTQGVNARLGMPNCFEEVAWLMREKVL